MSAATRKQLGELLEAATSCADFLGDVLIVLEKWRADEHSPEGFALLGQAVDAFEEDEGDDGDDDDDDDDEPEEDEPG